MRAGNSARRRHEAIRAARRQRVRRRWPLILVGVVGVFALGYALPGLILGSVVGVFGDIAPEADWSGLSDVPPALKLTSGAVLAVAAVRGLAGPSRLETAWARGAAGEEIAGRVLERLGAARAQTLHDLRMPGTNANIDHLLVTPYGVFVIDTKKYAGTLEVRRRREIWIKGRDRTSLVNQVARQAEATMAVLARAGWSSVHVKPVLCFVDTRLQLLTPQRVGGVILCTPRTIRRRLRSRGTAVLDPEQVKTVSAILEGALGFR